MFEYRHALVRLRAGDTVREIARTGTAFTSRLIPGIGLLRRAFGGGALAPGCSFRGGMRCGGCAPAFPATVARMTTKNGLSHDVKRWSCGLDPETN